ncbi:MAG TPA: hypothetical protein VJP39_05235, partial [Gaiellaceae bacterium]|nr:hypothetical protein [Gaiellaceae bacterium]
RAHVREFSNQKGWGVLDARNGSGGGIWFHVSTIEVDGCINAGLDPVTIAGFPVGTSRLVADVPILIRPGTRNIRANPGGATAFIVTGQP